jgi:hypothetical protein
VAPRPRSSATGSSSGTAPRGRGPPRRSSAASPRAREGRRRPPGARRARRPPRARAGGARRARPGAGDSATRSGASPGSTAGRAAASRARRRTRPARGSSARLASATMPRATSRIQPTCASRSSAGPRELDSAFMREEMPSCGDSGASWPENLARAMLAPPDVRDPPRPPRTASRRSASSCAASIPATRPP